MKLRYYLRGLGIGIIITALLMGVATRDKGKMTDEEIKERAALLGMVESKVLAEVSNTATPVPEITEKPVITPRPEETTKPVNNDEAKETPIPEASTEPEETPVPEATKEPAPTPKPEETKEPDSTEDVEIENVTLVIKSGETSWSISKDLLDKGLVTDAADFDNFLCKNGYDKTIRVGEFSIPSDATYEEIAKIIAR